MTPQAVRLDELGFSDVGDSLADMKILREGQALQFPLPFRRGQPEGVAGLRPGRHAACLRLRPCPVGCGLPAGSTIPDKPWRVKSHDTRNAIEALLAGKPARLTKTKVFGCSTKWSAKRDSAKKSLEAWAKEEVELKLIDEKGIKALVKNDGKNLRLINVWASNTY